MKKNIYNNLPFLIILILIILFGIIDFKKFEKDYKNEVNQYNITHKKCMENKDYLPRNSCDDLKNSNYKVDAINVFFYSLNHGLLGDYLQMFAPLLIMIAAVFPFFRKLKKRNINDYITRMSYKKFLWTSYLSSVKACLIFPIFFAILFILSYKLTGNLDVDFTIDNFPGIIYMPIKYMKSWTLFFPIFILNIILHSIFWSNLGIICVKKNDNPLVSCIIGYSIYFMIWCFLIAITNESSLELYFNLANIWVYDNVELLYMTMLSIAVFVISSILVFMKYKNEEEICYICEREID